MASANIGQTAENGGFIVSMTTYPKRIEHFKRAFSHLLGLDRMDEARKIVVALDDDLKDGEYSAYSDFLASFGDSRIETVKSEAKWGSANKLIPAYGAYGQTHSIACFDDDKAYPKDCLSQLLSASKGNGGCIISQEINPLIVSKDRRVGYFNNLDVKMGQREFGKFLSNGCLFPPKCLGDGGLLNDYDKFRYVTNGKHDELWFWGVATANGARSVGLDCTMGYIMDEGVNFESDDTALTNLNSRSEEVKGYNDRFDEVFGKDVLKAVDGGFVEFSVTHDRYFGVLYGMGFIHRLYDGQRLLFAVDAALPKSFSTILLNAINAFRWRNGVFVRKAELT